MCECDCEGMHVSVGGDGPVCKDVRLNLFTIAR